jgi:hypothetical protein
MKIGLAFLAGVLAGALMWVGMIIARAAGLLEMNMPMVLGAMVTQTTSRGTLLLGIGIHLVVSGLIGFVYAAAFEAIRRSNWWLGLIGGAINTIVGGLFVWMLPAIHPAMPEVLPAPGPFGVNLGAMNVVGFVILHLLFGLVIGVVYSPVHTPASPATPSRPKTEQTASAAGERR